MQGWGAGRCTDFTWGPNEESLRAAWAPRATAPLPGASSCPGDAPRSVCAHRPGLLFSLGSLAVKRTSLSCPWNAAAPDLRDLGASLVVSGARTTSKPDAPFVLFYTLTTTVTVPQVARTGSVSFTRIPLSVPRAGAVRSSQPPRCAPRPRTSCGRALQPLSPQQGPPSCSSRAQSKSALLFPQGTGE